MPNRNELVGRAAAANVDYTLAKYANDSVLEQAVIYAEQTMTAKTGTGSTKVTPAVNAAGMAGGANV